ncbi:hypothetical protein ACNPQM_12345 [Streptomyces sp. NPDC056231]|uniref:hypothetical protein n=1 Tax=Streptomyces sp. NPDC056231 TaxID=3345755 RepID=UPI003AAD63F1
MRRLRRLPSAPEPLLMAHLRTTVWGPAEFVGLPPRWLVVEGVLAGTLGAGAIVGTTLVGAWTGQPWLADGKAGLVCAVLLVLYLVLVGAGRALIGIVALLAVCLAIHAPEASAGIVLAHRGVVRPSVVMSVEDGGETADGHGLYFCSVSDRHGVPVKVRIRRGCLRTTRPGDALLLLYDPEVRVPPRSAESGRSLTAPLRALGAWSAALVGGCVIAVVRSLRLSHTAAAPSTTWVREASGPDEGPAPAVAPQPSRWLSGSRSSGSGPG